MQTFRLARAGFYQVRFANGRDAVIGVNPDRRESDLEPLAADVLKLWTLSSKPAGAQRAVAMQRAQEKDRTVSLWWYVMLLALMATLAETAIASRHMGTQREEI